MNEQTQNNYLECEKRWVFALLMIVGGFFGGFTYSLRGGVFCNAQTGNFLLFGLALGNGEWGKAMYYFIPMTAYFLGAFVSETIAYSIKKLHFIRWDTLFILIEMVSVIILALLPESAPFQITQVAINFICSMQYNTFRQAQSIPMATTFCTNHIRQVGVFAALALRHKDRASIDRMLFHGRMLLMFVIGVVCATLLGKVFLGKSLLFALIPLMIIFTDLFRADLTTERDRISEKPHGH